MIQPLSKERGIFSAVFLIVKGSMYSVYMMTLSAIRLLVSQIFIFITFGYVLVNLFLDFCMSFLEGAYYLWELTAF
jgi:hypothetical protein